MRKLKLYAQLFLVAWPPALAGALLTTWLDHGPPAARAEALRMAEAGRRRLETPDLTCRVRDRHGNLVRSASRRLMFLRMTGRDPGDPQCARVNHIVPLRCGGCDVPSNMECMSVEEWKARTGPEARDCGRHDGGEW